MNDKIYLETTAVIDATVKKCPELIDIIKSSTEKYTSQYVKMEIKKGFLNNIVLLHNKICNSEKWSDVQEYISRLSSTPLRNMLSTMLQGLASCWKSIEDQRPPDLVKKYGGLPFTQIMKQHSLSFLRTWIGMVMRKVDRISDEYINPMKCFKDIDPPVRDGELFWNKPVNCSGSAIECDIKKFFLDNYSDFQKIFQGLKSLRDNEIDNETKKRRKALKEILKILQYSTRGFSNHSQNQKLCWACGDAIHAVLAPSGAVVVNQNEKHFNDICTFIGKVSLSYKPFKE